MSILKDKTERKALVELARSIKILESLYTCYMTAQDDWDTKQAENLIRGIIQTNGYGIRYTTGRKTRIYKVK